MSGRQRIGSNDPDFHGRPHPEKLRSQTTFVSRSSARPSSRYFEDVAFPKQSGRRLQPSSQLPTSIEVVKAQPFVTPLKHQPQRSKVLRREAVRPPYAKGTPKRHGRLNRTQAVLVAMAVVIFLVGGFVSLNTFQTNHAASAQVAALAKQASSASNKQVAASSVPSTTPQSSASIADYTVAPNMPRYLNITSLGVHARILSLGTFSTGALATPDNIFDTGWYNKSSLPGQPGAMLIDGHISSWTAHGVFYDLKNLVPGDTVQVERGDGTMFTYKVVKSEVYPASGVNMQAAVTPINPDAPGLNLISCTGQVEKGTSEFNQRIIVFTQQV